MWKVLKLTSVMLHWCVGMAGNFNSWDRKPWVWLQDPYDPTSKPCVIPNMHRIHNNFIIRTSFLGPVPCVPCL